MRRWSILAATAVAAIALGAAGPGWAQRPVASNVAPPPSEAPMPETDGEADGEAEGYRIINGRNAQAEELPFQVQIFYLEPPAPEPGKPPVPRWQLAHVCGGALIAPQWVLTAAHCFFPKGGRLPGETNLPPQPAKWFAVRAGSVLITDAAQDGIEVPVAKLFVNPGYVPCKGCPPIGRTAKSPAHATEFTHDIALVRLARPLPVSDKISPVRLLSPSQGLSLSPGREVIASGWGLASNATATEVDVLGIARERAGNSSIRAKSEPILQVANLETVPCTGEGVLPTHFCAGGRDGADTCMGDSGGPLVIPRPGGAVLVGITSRRPFGERLCGGSTGARAKVETRYSRVDADHAEWIAGVMRR